MKTFKNAAFSVIAVLLLCCGARAETVDKLPKPTGYLSDFAGVVDASSAEQIEALCVQVRQQAHAQIAVVTIHKLEGKPVEEFANDLVRQWGIGTKGNDHGVLMLFAIDDHKRWIEVGYGLEGALNDAKVGDIGRTMVPQLKAGQYGPAIYGGLQQLANDVAADAGVTLTDSAPVQHTYHRQTVQSGLGLGTILRIIFFVVIVLFFLGRLGGGRGGRGGPGSGGGGLWWFLLGNMLSSGGGGRGYGNDGGGGWSSGGDSGGGSDSGGFGGFEGGSSGGGGAGGDW